MHLRKCDTFLPDIETNFPGYRKTIGFEGEYINDNHRYYAECPTIDDTNITIGIDGWLRRADALKLYEMGYFAPGNILEFGTYQGLSTSILSQANHDSGLKKEIHTVEIDGSLMKRAQENLQGRHLEQKVVFYHASSSEALVKILDRDKKFDFIFIDHSHEYDPVHEICEHMDALLNDGGYCLFHDYIHPDTFDETTQDFKVYQAVLDGLDKDAFEFQGSFGCTGLFRKKPRDQEVTIAQLTADYRNLRQRYVAMTIERNDLNIRNIRLTTEFENLRRHYLAMTAERDAREDQVTRMTDEIQEMSRHYAAMKAERDSLDAQMAAEINKAEERYDEVTRHYAAMKAERDSLADQMTAAIQDADRQYAEVSRHYAAMKEERDYLETRVRYLGSELDRLMHYRLMDTTIRINKFLENHRAQN